MRILLVCQYYKPEPFNVSDVCEELVRRGHDLTVLTGRPNYPEGEIYPGYEGDDRLEETIEGVNIIRTRIIPRKTGVVNRVLNYFSFPFLAKKRLKKINSEFDLVISFQLSPVMMAEPAIDFASAQNIPVLLYVLDLWPESLVAGGITRDSLIYKLFKHVSKRIYSNADAVAVTSKGFIPYLEHLISRSINALYLPQYAESEFDSDGISAPIGYDSTKTNLTFAGNIGSAQSVQTIVRAAAMLKDSEHILFHIVGSGSELENCKALAKELDATNVIFHGRHSLEEMPAFYSASSAMLATFSNEPVLGYTLPRKIQSYMAASRPVLGTLVGEAKRVIEEADCGICCDAEDSKGLARICHEFSNLPKSRQEQMGQLAKQYYDAHFSRDAFFETLESELDKLKGTKHGD